MEIPLIKELVSVGVAFGFLVYGIEDKRTSAKLASAAVRLGRPGGGDRPARHREDVERRGDVEGDDAADPDRVDDRVDRRRQKGPALPEKSAGPRMIAVSLSKDPDKLSVADEAPDGFVVSERHYFLSERVANLHE
jgi:hypothetical protein